MTAQIVASAGKGADPVTVAAGLDLAGRFKDESQLAVRDPALTLGTRGRGKFGIVDATDAGISTVAVIGALPAASHAPVTSPFAIGAGAATPRKGSLPGVHATGDAGLAFLER